MPRWESKSAKKEQVFELLLDGDRLWSASGYRTPGETEWIIAQHDPKEFRFNEGAPAAQADYDKRVGKLPKSAVKVSDTTPVIDPVRARRTAEREALAASMRAWEAKHGLVAQLKAHGVARLVGLNDSNGDEYVEVAIEGTTVLTRRGKLSGGKPRTEKSVEPTIEAALSNAQIALMANMSMGSFGPKLP